MASAMRKMAVYLGLVEDDDRRYQDKYDSYEDYDEYDDEPDAVEVPPAAPADYSAYSISGRPGRTGSGSAADGPAADHDAPPAHLQ